MENYPENAIKSFLHIENPRIKDDPFYEINSYQNIITLYNPSEKKNSENSSKFELDKIFTNNDENSYIYEEICLNTIKDCLEGFSYSFISYGETSSKKLETLIGNLEDNITNINNRGIYPRLLEQLLYKINKKENNNYNISMSFFMIYGNNLIDLSLLKNIENKNITKNNLLNKAYNIKNETDIIKNISKINIENVEDNLKYINKILSNLINIEKTTKENIYSTSHICIILYITNKQENKIIKISNISFILLNGSEYLYSGESKKLLYQDQNNNIKNKMRVEGAKNTLETQFTYETIYNCIKSVKCLNIINGKGKKFNENITKENILYSPLTTVLYNICFGDNIKKIKFRIIGTIFPNTGFYHSVKDTILFLYECKNIMKRKKDKITNLENLYETSSEIIDKKKDDYIFQLENKVKNYKKRIDELNKTLEQKEKKITFLQNTYIAQINTLKKKLNFPGDINVLISGDENTKEANFVREMKDYRDVIKRNEGNINILEKKLKEANDEIIKLKNKNIMKNLDETMINYYISLRQNEENKNKEDKSLKILYNKIEGLKQELISKDKINNGLKKELEKKNNILFNLPLSLKENYTLNKDFIINNNNIKNKEISTKSNKDTEIKLEKLNEKEKSESESIDNDVYYEEKMKKINEENEKNIINIKFKYENIIKEKNNEINKYKKNIENILNDYNNEINKWKNELNKYNEIFMKLLSNYKRIFFSKFPPQYSLITLKNKKEEFDNILTELEKEINYLNFPKLFTDLELNKNLGITITGSVSNMRKTLFQKNISKKNNKISKENEKKSENNFENLKMPIPPLSIEQIKNTVDENLNDKKKLIINKEILENMSKESIIIHCLKLNKIVEEIENYLEIYAQYKKGFNIEQFENNINYKENIIKELNEKINKLQNNLDEQIQINYNNMNVINTQNRMIEKFQKEKYLNSLLNKNKNYYATILNENSTYSTLIHSLNNKNNGNNLLLEEKKMKKSNSCYDLDLLNNNNNIILKKLNKNDTNIFSSARLLNETINKKNKNILRPFSSTRQLKKKEFN